MKIALILSILAVAMVIISGCCGMTPSAPGGTTAPIVQAENNSTSNVTSPPAVNETKPPTGDGTIVDVGGNTGTGNGSAGQPANSQVDCSTMTPTCDDCVAKAGCGWCKSKNGCFYGNASGNSCQPGDWTTTSNGCAAPVGGDTCGSKTNCADCLSGSACKWCQEGTKCADKSSSDACASGGWRTTSYQCYGGQ